MFFPILLAKTSSSTRSMGKQTRQSPCLESALTSGNRASYTIQGESSRGTVATGPGTVKAKVGVGSWSNGAIVREIARGDIAARLGIARVPDLGDCLPIG